MTAIRGAIDVDVVIVGASLAGVRTGEALRQVGFTGSVLLVGDEDELPYDRPPLSKHFLAGTSDRDRIRLLTAERAAELGIELRLGAAASALDAAAHRVTLESGETIGYRACVVATGVTARPSPWPGAAVHTLRSLANSERLVAAMTPGSRVVVVGSGYIGAEVAGTAHARGCQVTVVDTAPNPYLRSLGDELGSAVCEVHARHGVQSLLGVAVAGIADGARATLVELVDGTKLLADSVVVGIGATPNTDWLAASGLIVDDGIVCDEFGRALGVVDVFAAGDVARWGSVRQEHWTSAIEQARAVGHNVAHPDDLVTSAGDGYVWSDQYDWKIQLAGHTGADWACEVIGDRDALRPKLAGLYRDAVGRLVGVATVNWPKVFLTSRQAIGTAYAHEISQQLQAQPDRVTA